MAGEITRGNGTARGLRLTGGAHRGRRIPLPGHDLRPTSERARQAYFNIIGSQLPGASFLDLFAGSGIFSFEAVSRGAASAVAIDQGAGSAESINQLAAEWSLPVKGIAADVFAGMKRLRPGVFGLVYADPPYDFQRYAELILAIGRDVPLTSDAVVAIEHRRNATPFTEHTSSLRLLRVAEYGEVWISFFEHEVRK